MHPVRGHTFGHFEVDHAVGSEAAVRWVIFLADDGDGGLRPQHDQPQLQIGGSQRSRERRPPGLDQRIEPLLHALDLKLVALPAIQVEAGHELGNGGQLDQPARLAHPTRADGVNEVCLGEQRHDLLGTVAEHQELAAQLWTELAAGAALLFGSEAPQLTQRHRAIASGEEQQLRSGRGFVRSGRGGSGARRPFSHRAGAPPGWRPSTRRRT